MITISGEIKVQSLQELHDARESVNQQIQQLKTKLSEIDGAIVHRTKGLVEQMFTLAGKQSGTVKVAGDDGMVINGEIPKKVEWDTAKLMAVAETMSAEEALEIFDIKFSVPEKKFTSLAGRVDPAAHQAILDARTVKYGDMKISLEAKR